MGHTFSVLEALLDQGVIDVCEDLELLKVSPHAIETILLPKFTARNLRCILSNESLNALSLLCNLQELLFPVRL